MKTVQIGEVLLGEQEPLKICVPIAGKDAREVFLEAYAAADEAADVVEWRLDYLEDCDNQKMVSEMIKELVLILKGIPLLVTVRTEAEGGNYQGDWQAYHMLVDLLITLDEVDAVDIQMSCPTDYRQALLKKAKLQGKPSVLSYHDFYGMPTLPDITNKLDEMSYCQPDLIKMAYKVTEETELLRLSLVKEQWNVIQPLILIGMGEVGQPTRTNKQGVLTFATVRSATAPGQLTISEVRRLTK
ncbi:type I 3-dehydroquinate dehydratase [Vagococcus coleopterorum]|uniref:3-dehydroquinate dehydratase n=1 Tax=Vagococcus coleopterorum TaxID=2714946 RepID=A0A6G8AMR0_9ENTE|nr:type I 3-dehydroquinate dehydratase [Vagococcus coleopterorum]QIL46260.1 type I 3-dehydroquinate dehydratase [Vagococcus coleopterorum]